MEKLKILPEDYNSTHKIGVYEFHAEVHLQNTIWIAGGNAILSDRYNKVIFNLGIFYFTSIDFRVCHATV
jgi:hypothetical protein